MSLPLPSTSPRPKALAPAADELWLALAAGLLLLGKCLFLNHYIGKAAGLGPVAVGTMIAVAAGAAAMPFLLPRGPRLMAFVLLDALLSTVLVGDLLYFRYFRDVPTVGALSHIGQVGSVQASVWALFEPKYALFFLDLPVLLGLSAWRLGRVPARLRGGWPWRAALGVVLLAGLLAPVGAAGAGAPGEYRNVTASRIGLLGFHMVDLGRAAARRLTPPPPLDPRLVAETEAWFADQRRPAPGRHFGLAAGKSLIVVQVEALQGFVVGRSVNGRAITPRLNALLSETAHFPRIYSQTRGGGTSDAELMALTGLYPAEEGAAFMRFVSHRLEALPRALAERGYHTSVLHANVPQFWNRHHMYPALGFARYFNVNDYHFDERAGIGLSDRSFFRQSLARLAAMPRPFFSHMITLTSHYPFDGAEAYSDFDVSGVEDPMIANYLRSIHYADAALGELVDGLKREGLWEEAVVAIYGDHFAIPAPKREALLAFTGGATGDHEVAWERLQRVPFMIHLPGGALSGRYPVTGGQIDFMPTIANLMGLEAGYAAGRDLFAAKDGWALLPSGAVATDTHLYLPSRDRAFELTTGAPASTSSLERTIAEAGLHRVMSRRVLEDNLLGRRLSP